MNRPFEALRQHWLLFRYRALIRSELLGPGKLTPVTAASLSRLKSENHAEIHRLSVHVVRYLQAGQNVTVIHLELDPPLQGPLEERTCAQSDRRHTWSRPLYDAPPYAAPPAVPAADAAASRTLH